VDRSCTKRINPIDTRQPLFLTHVSFSAPRLQMATDAKDKKEFEECTIVVEELNNPAAAKEIVDASGILADLAKIVVGYGSNGCAITAQKASDCDCCVELRLTELRWTTTVYFACTDSRASPYCRIGYYTKDVALWRELCKAYDCNMSRTIISARDWNSGGALILCLWCGSEIKADDKRGQLSIYKDCIAWTHHTG